MKKVWLVEDDGFKRDKLRACLREVIPQADIREAKSAKSAFNFLREGAPDLVVLDMSLPTFDIGPTESGGRPQGFGGVEVLREMDRKGVRAPVIVVTQYEFFGEERVSIHELASRLRAEHVDTFSALVFYEAASEQWKVGFKDAVIAAINRCGSP
jgi:CheY-like chemotaxis protein